LFAEFSFPCVFWLGLPNVLRHEEVTDETLLAMIRHRASLFTTTLFPPLMLFLYLDIIRFLALALMAARSSG